MVVAWYRGCLTVWYSGAILPGNPFERLRMTTKAMTLRLPADKAAELEAIARIDNVSIAEAVRAAIDERIAQRRQDSDFQARLRAIVEQDRAILERLAS